MNREKYLKDFKKFSKKLSLDKEACKNFLVKAGIITKKGNLNKNYK